MPSGKNPPILCASDRTYLPYLAVLVSSLANVARLQRLVVISQDLTLHDRRQIEFLTHGELTLEWVSGDPNSLRARGLEVFACKHPSYLRLLAPHFLPHDERAIYLDADTIVRSDVGALLHWPLNGRPLAAVRDYLPCVGDAVGNYDSLGLDPRAPYFNAGVLVMDLDLWRRENNTDEVVEICQRHTPFLLAQGRWPQYEQYGLNVVVAGRWATLPGCWNHGSELVGEDARIVHFIGNGKPGSLTCQSVFSDDFFSRLANTPWSHWRPEEKHAVPVRRQSGP